ncbi:reticulocyte-binding protein 3-like [Prorops nasuta]|uniref:reticulocyte-binding protein 3-like n=1 Tax=Prorops nasuta TaxID=863751 RepID=UPI0034CF1939
MEEGIAKEEKSEILNLVPRKYKECNMNAPILNEEILSNLKEDAVKRDKYLYNYQNMIGSSISLTGAVLSMISNDKNEEVDRDIVLQYLSDALKINADLFHSWTIARKVYITPRFEKKVKTALDKTTPTEYLFGDNIKELINNVKAVEIVGKDLNSNNNNTNNRVLRSNSSINWKGSSGNREVNQSNRGQKSYFTSKILHQRNNQRPQKPNYRRNYNQSQPIQQQKK